MRAPSNASLYRRALTMAEAAWSATWQISDVSNQSNSCGRLV